MRALWQFVVVLAVGLLAASAIVLVRLIHGREAAGRVRRSIEAEWDSLAVPGDRLAPRASDLS